METIWPVFLGIGLAAACGFRVFVPMLAIITSLVINQLLNEYS